MSFEVIDRLPLEEIAPSSRLGIAYLRGDAAALPFYGSAPEDLAGAVGRALEAHSVDRGELTSALGEFNTSLGAGPETMSNIDLLSREGTVAVVTGQQTAPLTGPLYTIFKALSAVLLCRRIRETAGLEAVPVFWAEGDDHDLEEVSSVGTGYLPDGSLRELRLDRPAGGVGGPVGDLPLDPGLLRGELEEHLPHAEYREEILESFFPESGGTTLGLMFCKLMSRLMSKHGLIIAYSRQERFRQLLTGIIPRVLEEAPELTEEVVAASRRIVEAGFKAQIHRRREAAPFFVIRKGKRLTVTMDEDRFTLDGETLSRRELGEGLAGDPLSFSPGVTLRAVLQDHLLPTAAYVGGLSEAAYFGQLKGVYRRMGVSMPVISPRLSATFVEAGPARILDKFSLKPSAFVTGTSEEIFSGVVAAGGEHSDPGRWEALRQDSLAPLAAYEKNLPPDLAPLKSGLRRTAGRIHHLLKKAEEKTNQALRSREEETGKQIRRVSSLLRPGGSLMERKLNIFYFMSKYGPDFGGRLMEAAPDDPMHHHFIRPGGA